MSEVQNTAAVVKNKPGPKPKVNKEAITKKTAGPTRKNRVPMHSSVGSGRPKEASDPDYYYRKCADYGKGKIQRYLDAGYEYVCYDGTSDKIMYPGGSPRWLMRIPMKDYLEDQEDKKQNVINTNKKVMQDAAIDKGGDVPDYLPKGSDGVISKSDPLS